MKTYEQLTPDEQKHALDRCVQLLLKDIIEGSIRFNDKANKDRLQAKIDKALAKAEKMQTPWYAAEYIMDTCKDEIEGLAICDAQDAIYSEPGETIIRGIVKPAPKSVAA